MSFLFPDNPMVIPTRNSHVGLTLASELKNPFLIVIQLTLDLEIGIHSVSISHHSLRQNLQLSISLLSLLFQASTLTGLYLYTCRPSISSNSFEPIGSQEHTWSTNFPKDQICVSSQVSAATHRMVFSFIKWVVVL